jgi:hypothetical protein
MLSLGKFLRESVFMSSVYKFKDKEVVEALDKVNGEVKLAAQLLGVSPRTMNRLKKGVGYSPGRKPWANLTDEEILEALEECEGSLTDCAAYLGVSYYGLKKLRAQRPSLKAEIKLMQEAFREELLEMAESGIRECLEAKAPWALCYTSKCLGKDRGWIERPQKATESKETAIKGWETPFETKTESAN